MIGYYVHHHGSGHLHRMCSIAAELRRFGHPVAALSSLPPPCGWEGEWVRLDRDDDPMPDPDAADVTAHGTLHWVPRDHPGLARRTAQVATWIERRRPTALVVDVSVEVALLARLCGVPVVVVAMPGRRRDRAHTLAYDQAETLLAPWPAGLDSDWPREWQARTTYAGAISRFDGHRAAGPTGPEPAMREHGTGLVLWGHGGDGRAVADLLRATPDRQWALATPEQPLGADQVWDRLRRVEVVVTHAGQNAVAEVAAAGTPAVVVADDRPFDEQRHTAQRLADLGLAAAVTGWPAPDRWAPLVERAVALGGAGWDRWNDGQGAARAAAAIDAVARR